MLAVLREPLRFSLFFLFPTSLCGVLTFTAPRPPSAVRPRRPPPAPPPPPPHSHSLSHSHSHTLTHTLTHTHSLTHALTHTHSHTLSHTRTHTHSLTFTHTHTHSLTLTHTHTHSLSHAHSHTLTHTHSLTLTHSRSLTLTWACVCVAGAAFGSCLKGWDVVARAARGARNRGRRCTLKMPLPKSSQAQHSVNLSVCWHGRGSIWQLSKGLGCCRARGSGRAKSWQAQHFGDAVAEVVAGAAFCASERVCVLGRGSIWQLSKGMGCCRARGSGRAKSWQAQHFEDAVAEVVAGAAFCASERGFAWQGQHLAAV